MVKCSIYSSRDEVFKGLNSFLHERGYKHIVLNKAEQLIVAKRRDSFFGKKYSVRFLIRPKSDAVCDIEITVNPHHSVATLFDSKKEEKIRSRIYFFF